MFIANLLFCFYRNIKLIGIFGMLVSFYYRSTKEGKMTCLMKMIKRYILCILNKTLLLISYKTSQINLIVYLQDSLENQEGWSSDNDVEVPLIDDTKDKCRSIAENLVLALQGVENDNLDTISSTKYGHVGRAVSKTLSQMSSYEAANASHKIMEILLLYDKDNPDNPNNKSLKTEG